MRGTANSWERCLYVAAMVAALALIAGKASAQCGAPHHTQLEADCNGTVTSGYSFSTTASGGSAGSNAAIVGNGEAGDDARVDPVPNGYSGVAAIITGSANFNTNGTALAASAYSGGGGLGGYGISLGPYQVGGTGNITTTGNDAPTMNTYIIAGNGRAGGGADGVSSTVGQSGAGGNGTYDSLTISGQIITSGDDSPGIAGGVMGSAGGIGTSTVLTDNNGGAGGAGGNAGYPLGQMVGTQLQTPWRYYLSVNTSGANSQGIVLNNVGGSGGAGGVAVGGGEGNGLPDLLCHGFFDPHCESIHRWSPQLCGTDWVLTART